MSGLTVIDSSLYGSQSAMGPDTAAPVVHNDKAASTGASAQFTKFMKTDSDTGELTLIDNAVYGAQRLQRTKPTAYESVLPSFAHAQDSTSGENDYDLTIVDNAAYEIVTVQ